MHDAAIFALNRGAFFAAIASYCKETQRRVRQKGQVRYRGLFTDKLLILHLTRKCSYEGALALQHDTSYLMNLNTRPSAINPAKNATLNTIPATTVARASGIPDKPSADVPHHASNVPGTAAQKMATTDSR